MKKTIKGRYSYIRKSWSITGWYCLGIAAVTLGLTVLSAVRMMTTGADVDASVGAMGISCILLDTMGLVFTVIGLRETDKNQFFVKSGGCICSGLLILWLLVAAVGAGK